MAEETNTDPTEVVRKAMPQWLYEALRWITVAVFPFVGAALGILDVAWGWGLPIVPIQVTLDIIAFGLGALFLGSKVVTDYRDKKEQINTLTQAVASKKTKK